MPKDPRWFQIAFLSSLLALGLFRLDFQIQPAQVLAIFAGGLFVQACFLRALRLEGVGYKSTLITCLGLSLLLRANGLWAPFALSAAASASKFVFRIKGSHLFNPANFGVVLGLLTAAAWVSPAQWGHGVVLAAWLAMLGASVARRAGREDVSWSFLAFYLGLCVLRTWYLGQRCAVFLHQLENGSLLLFTFFMISDPRTIPQSRSGRIAFAGLAALAVFARQFVFFRTNGLFYALFVLTPTTPLWNWMLGGERHHWVAGENHESSIGSIAAAGSS